MHTVRCECCCAGNKAVAVTSRRGASNTHSRLQLPFGTAGTVSCQQAYCVLAGCLHSCFSPGFKCLAGCLAADQGFTGAAAGAGAAAAAAAALAPVAVMRLPVGGCCSCLCCCWLCCPTLLLAMISSSSCGSSADGDLQHCSSATCVHCQLHTSESKLHA